MADNKLRYYRIDAARREAARREWNRPIVWPVVLLVLFIVLATIPAFRSYRRRERMAAREQGAQPNPLRPPHPPGASA